MLYSQYTCFETEYSSFYLPDSILIIPASIQVSNAVGEQQDFEFSEHYLIINSDQPAQGFTVCYNYLKKKQEFVSSALPITQYDSSIFFTDVLATDADKQESTQEFLGLGGIDMDGAFMRSVSGGGQQSARMHSVMDLTLSGKINPELALEARLTDQQMPFEPEGNTQRLQDFDRVNVKLLHQNWNLEAGDMLVQSLPNSKFIRYNRQVQGVGIATPALSIDSTQSNTSVVTSFARSKSTVQMIEPLEGVLGPYRIRGPQNEPFIFILANSERVYLDGKLLNRGLEHDYVIDYNAAEIIFNTHLYLTKYSRIQVEFEYSDRQYSRNVSTVQHQQSLGKVDLRINYFQELDQPGNALFDLSQQDMESLSQLNAASTYGEIPAVDSLGFHSDKIRYALKDTVVAGYTYQFYHNSKNPELAHYQVNFMLVGQNQGDYIIAPSMNNAITYQWVAPIDGVSQGNYSPVKKIALPKKHRVINIGADYHLKNKAKISFDYAGTELISNRFNKDGSKANGNALAIAYESAMLPLSFIEDTRLSYFIGYEYIDSTFSPLQPFRDVEFNRNWGAQESALFQAGEEHLVHMGAQLVQDKSKANYRLALRNNENAGQGYQQTLDYQHNGKFQIKSSAFIMQNRFQAMDTEWKKATIDVQYADRALQPGYMFRTEQHLNFLSDSIVNSFQYFNSHLFYLEKIDSSKWSFHLSHEIRDDSRPAEGEMNLFETAHNTRFNTSLQYGQNQKIDFNILRRSITPHNELVQATDFYQGGLNWIGDFWDNNISHQFHYQTGTGRVLERSYFFMEVARGLGTHSWADLNGNEEQELNEFFEDNTDYGDRNYVKILTMGDDYQTAFINNLRYQLRWKMPNSWKKSASLLNYLGRFSGQFQSTFESKNTFEEWKQRLSPFSTSAEDNILSARSLWKTSVYYNRGGRVFLEAAWSELQRKQLLMDGFEGNGQSAFYISGTVSAFTNWNFVTIYQQSANHSFSDFIEARDFQYYTNSINPQILWQTNKHFRLQLSYENAHKLSPDETIGGGVNINEFSFSNKFIQSNGGILESKLSYVGVNSALADDRSPLAYEMFEGLRAGENFVWNVSLRRKIIGDLNLVLQYIGRKSESIKTVHGGNIQLTALF